jgi:hypothetical protein
MQQQSPGISVDFTPEVEMVLRLQATFPPGSNRPPRLDQVITELLALIAVKASLQEKMLADSKFDLEAKQVIRQAAEHNQAEKEARKS